MMALEETIRKGFLGRVKDYVSNHVGYIGIPTTIAASLLANKAQAAPTLDDPLNALPTSSSPISSYAKPTGAGNLTGADGDVNSATWAAVTDSDNYKDGNGIGKIDGRIYLFNGANPTPSPGISTGIAGLSGIAYLGNNRWALSAGRHIYEGTISNNTWTEDRRIDFLDSDFVSNITDLDYALGKYFISTESNGIGRVESDGKMTELKDANGIGLVGWKSVDVIGWKTGSFVDQSQYPVIQYGQGSETYFQKMGGNGVEGNAQRMSIITGTFPNLFGNNEIQGMAYFSGGSVFVDPEVIFFHNTLTSAAPESINLQNLMTSTVPEPTTAGLVGIAIATLGTYSLRRKD